MPENVLWIDKRYPGMEQIWFLGPEKRDTGTYAKHWGFAVRIFPGPTFFVRACFSVCSSVMMAAKDVATSSVLSTNSLFPPKWGSTKYDR